MIPYLYPESGSEASDGNSSTSALSASATFTGDWVQSDLPDMLVVCDTDAGGILYVDYSVDGTNAITFPVTDVLFFEADTDTNGTDIHVRFSLNVYENQ